MFRGIGERFTHRCDQMFLGGRNHHGIDGANKSDGRLESQQPRRLTNLAQCTPAGSGARAFDRLMECKNCLANFANGFIEFIHHSIHSLAGCIGYIGNPAGALQAHTRSKEPLNHQIVQIPSDPIAILKNCQALLLALGGSKHEGHSRLASEKLCQINRIIGSRRGALRTQEYQHTQHSIGGEQRQGDDGFKNHIIINRERQLARQRINTNTITKTVLDNGILGCQGTTPFPNALQIHAGLLCPA